MGRRFTPARLPVGEAPNTQSGVYAAGQTFKQGAILVDEAGATGNLVEGGVDPAPIVGVALDDADSKPGFQMANSPSVVTGRVSEASFVFADRTTIFSGRGVNGGTDPTTPVQADITKTVGLLRTAAGEWVLDFADLVNTRVKITDIDIDNKIFFFKFLESVLARP